MDLSVMLNQTDWFERWYRTRKSIPISNKSVTGTVLTENYITLNNNGTEANQTHAVIILTDAAKTYSKRTISIKFTTPISTSPWNSTL
jgi:hypothetical protein